MRMKMFHKFKSSNVCACMILKICPQIQNRLVTNDSRMRVVKYFWNKSIFRCNKNMDKLNAYILSGNLPGCRELLTTSIELKSKLQAQDIFTQTYTHAHPESPMHSAAYSGKHEIMKFLIESGGNINAVVHFEDSFIPCERKSSTSLLQFARKKSSRGTLALVTQSENVLCAAIRGRQWNMVNLLLDYNCNAGFINQFYCSGCQLEIIGNGYEACKQVIAFAEKKPIKIVPVPQIQCSPLKRPTDKRPFRFSGHVFKVPNWHFKPNVPG